MTDLAQQQETQLDGVQLAVLETRFEGIVRAMLNTLLRSGRSGVINTAHDFSCCILTADDELLSWAESVPIHVVSGPDMMSRAMKEFHPTLQRGDAFLHNSPYHGNSHAADWSMLIPVIDDEGRHRFTAFAKAHVADCGNSEPTTYSWRPRDVYEEGALFFPAVKVQEDYADNEDIIRMCQTRIRVPDQWWGDYLALLGAARIGERRLLELIDEMGADTLAAYSRQWFDHSEQRMIEKIRELPSGRMTATTAHDAIPTLGEPIPISSTVEIDSENATITVDITDNPDCLPCGLNLSEACARTAAMIGVFHAIGREVPSNAGSFRRLNILVRENCCVGIPRHPASCSSATTNLMDRVANTTLRCMAELCPGEGLAEFGVCQAPAGAVLSGRDPRHDDQAFVNQLSLAVTGGPGGVATDGWLMAYNIGSAGMLYQDSVEVDEIKHPIRVVSQRLVPDTEGAGWHRGSPSAYVEYGPVGCSIEALCNSDGAHTPARGVRGGTDGGPTQQYKRGLDGELTEISGFARLTLEPGETIVSISPGGGGYEAPWKRDPALVVEDVAEGWITRERAGAVYGVVLGDDGSVDEAATGAARAALAARDGAGA